ncbi:EamA family transporter [bacterium]|nr:EamA family transporter [bacterium]
MSLTTAIPPRPPIPLPQQSRLGVAHLICMLSMVIWAAGLPANSVLLPILPPMALSALRLALAAAALIPFWLWREGGQMLRDANWRLGAGVGSLIGAGSLLIILGQARTDAVTVAVISAALPVVGLTLEIFLDGRKLTLALMVGVVFALAGGLVALGPGAGGVSFGLGAVMCLFSVLLYALGSRLTVTSFPTLTPLGRSAVTLGGAALTMGIAALGAQGAGLVPAADFHLMGPREWAAMFIFAVVSLAVSQVLWIISVERLGIGMAALHINAAPFYVMLIALAFGGGWSWWQAAGAALVGLGVIVSQGLPGRSTSGRDKSGQAG